MKTRFTLIIFLFAFLTSNFAQVGIGTSNPHASAMMDVDATNKGFLLPRMTSVQRSAIASPATGLQVYDLNTNSIWYFNAQYWMNTLVMSALGDVKSGIQTIDHEGWIKLDGRLISTLSVTQQSAATSLGLSGNLPNASNAYLVQNGGGMGAVSGANTTTLAQTNLPNVNFTGTAANAGGHSHTTDPAAINSSAAGGHDHSIDPPSQSTTSNGTHSHTSYYANPNNPSGINGGVSGGNWFGGTGTATSVDGNHQHAVDIPGFNSVVNGDHTHSIDVPSTTSTTAPDHSHAVSVASGGSATPINIAPKSLSVNMFIYLGQ